MSILLWILGILVGHLLVGVFVAYLFVKYDQDTSVNEVPMFIFIWPIMLFILGPVMWIMIWLQRVEGRKEHKAQLARDEKDRLWREERDRNR